MRTPPPAYSRMRAAYARWFWKVPAGLLLMALAMAVNWRSRGDHVRPRRGAPPMRALLFAAGVAVLLDSVKDRAVYEANRDIYASTPDSMA